MAEDGRATVIEVTDVSKVHHLGEVAVDALLSVSFVVREGEFVAIMGPSGSGKTTLLGILGCLDRPTSGSYRLVGEEMSELGETERARIRGARIGFVFQAYNLIPRSTAYKNVELPLVYAGVRTRASRGPRGSTPSVSPNGSAICPTSLEASSARRDRPGAVGAPERLPRGRAHREPRLRGAEEVLETDDAGRVRLTSWSPIRRGRRGPPHPRLADGASCRRARGPAGAGAV